MAKSNNSGSAFTYGFIGIAVLAAAMVAFYKYKERSRVNEADIDLSDHVEISEPREGVNSYVGTYSPTSPIEAIEHRFSFFTVNKKDEGGYLGSAKMEPIGGGSPEYFECNDVKASEAELFLRCVSSNLGSLSFSGTWLPAGDGAPSAEGKFLWVKDGSAIADQRITVFLNANR
ncbi:MAG: hypothetical protein M9962_04065 [Oligoflexia bacterium]|nr:hypothetical protein [Oligoflexia bacterium]